MSTKYHKLLERGSGITSVVTDAQLRGLKQGPAFKRVYREMGPATEADMAEYRKNNPVEEAKPATAKPTGTDLPNTTKPATSKPAPTQGEGGGNKPS